MSKPEEIRYATYRGSGHVPMFQGIPLIPCLILFGLAIAAFFIFFLFLGWIKTGVAVIAIIGMVAIWLRVECAIESRAMEIRLLEFKGLALRLKKGGQVLEVTSNIQTEKKELENVQRFVKAKNSI